MLNMIRRVAPAAALLSFILLLTPIRAAELQPVAVVQNFYDALLAVMKEGRSLGFDGRYQKLKPALSAAFDLPLMARLSIGQQWQNLAASQQAALTAAFGEYTYSTYASRFDDYSGERFEVLPQTTPAAGGVIVQTRLIKGDGEPITLNYLMRQDGQRWQIIDVFLSGTVSELATRRSEFTSVLRREGPDGLIRLLAKRASALRTS
ncbi:MAG TPA: ABC transporter substrate-binding protein [Stellaceae bacterium]|nr:ABC transporter substrate-binding protein [Stellaceae bacterium]